MPFCSCFAADVVLLNPNGFSEYMYIYDQSASRQPILTRAVHFIILRVLIIWENPFFVTDRTPTYLLAVVISLIAIKQATKFTSAIFHKHVKSKLYHVISYKTMAKHTSYSASYGNYLNEL